MEVIDRKVGVMGKLRTFIDTLDAEQRWYFFSLFVGLLVLGFYGFYYVQEVYNVPPLLGAWMSVVFVASFGVMIFFSTIFTELIKNVIWRSCFSLLFIFLVTLSLTLADGMINDTFKVPSSPFIYTQTIVSILQIPLFVIVASAALSVLFIILIVLFPYITSMEFFKLIPSSLEIERDKKHKKLTYAARFLVILSIGYMSFDFLEKSDGYYSFIKSTAKEYAYSLEMEKYTHCEVKEAGEHFAYLDPINVVVGVVKNNNYVFVVRPCKETIAAGVGRTLDETVKGVGRGIVDALNK